MAKDKIKRKKSSIKGSGKKRKKLYVCFKGEKIKKIRCDLMDCNGDA